MGQGVGMGGGGMGGYGGQAGGGFGAPANGAAGGNGAGLAGVLSLDGRLAAQGYGVQPAARAKHPWAT